jgi:hypothetical protein
MRVEIKDAVVVNANASDVWEAIRDPSLHADWHPFVDSIRGEHAQGASRRCAIRVGKKAGETEEHCTAYDEGQRILWQIDEDSTGSSASPPIGRLGSCSSRLAQARRV